MTPIAWLDDLDATDEADVGGKLAKLADLRRAGLETPPGFAVRAWAFAELARESGVGTAIESFLARVDDPDDLDAIERAAQAVRSAIEAAAMPATLAHAIAEAYEALSDRCRDLNVPTAVRSSALAEDRADASYAGQYDTFLGVTGTEAVLTAVKRCWASLFNGRALAYRLRAGDDPRDSAIAVGVLELVPARCSGVAFSMHPVTGKRDRIVVEGSWGWGEAVVKGLVVPDHLEVDKADGRTLRYDVARKDVVSLFDYAQGMVVEAPMPARLRERPILDDEQLGAVVDAVLAVERHFGFPVDVEWVISRHRRSGEPVTVVQARPETVNLDVPPTPTWDTAAMLRHAFGSEPR